MTTGLQGGGTEVDPWLISSPGELATVCRDAGSSGWYRVVAVMDAEELSLSVGSAALFATYYPKVIDLNGYVVRFTLASSWLVGNLHFENGEIEVRYTASSSTSAFFMCAFTDMVIRIGGVTSPSRALCSGSTTASNPSMMTIKPRRFTRVQLGLLDAPTAALPSNQLSSGGFSASLGYIFPSIDLVCNVLSTASFGEGATVIAAAPITWDSLTSSYPALAAAWQDSGWFMSSPGLFRPRQAELIELSILTLIAGEPVSRRVWAESAGAWDLLGVTDSAGELVVTYRHMSRTPFRLLAAEDFKSRYIRSYINVVAGQWLVPPTVNGYAYVAQANGNTGDASAAVWGGSPVVLNGVTYAPRSMYASVLSDLRLAIQHGTVQSIVLEPSGSGGPVIEGDPAYLEGQVEEIHPMLGTLRPLANAEVIAFERRAAGYVAMGSAYSNGAGGFRIDTEVYGGGDIFAFAADFPGVIWQPGIELSTGDRVRPTVNNGYVYEVITPGNSGATEPTWWADTGDGTEGAIGGATAKARPYYQPVGHGPLKMTFVE